MFIERSKIEKKSFDNNKSRDGTRLFPGIPGNQKSPGILEKVKKFWNSGKSEKILESGKTKTVV